METIPLVFLALRVKVRSEPGKPYKEALSLASSLATSGIRDHPLTVTAKELGMATSPPRLYWMRTINNGYEFGFEFILSKQQEIKQ